MYQILSPKSEKKHDFAVNGVLECSPKISGRAALRMFYFDGIDVFARLIWNAPPKEQLLPGGFQSCKDVLLKTFTSQSFMLKLAGFPGVESYMILLIGLFKATIPRN